MTPEGAVRNQVCSYLRSRGVYFFLHDSVGIFDPKTKRFRRNNSPYRIRGVSDILGILPGGRFLAIELKSATGVLTKEQKSFLEAIRANGGVSFMARSVEDVKAGLDGIA
ncbi:hypothetical protein EBZ39_05280 [bacterium]|nr:hypothetical protein [bacterium]